MSFTGIPGGPPQRSARVGGGPAVLAGRQVVARTSSKAMASLGQATDFIHQGMTSVEAGVASVQSTFVDAGKKLLGNVGLGAKMGKVPLLQREVLIDAGDAAIVMVFPRDADCGGVVEADAEVPEPIREAAKIFLRAQNLNSEDSMKDIRQKLGDGPCYMWKYQEAVRAQMLKMFKEAGFKASSLESIDGDEVFLKVQLDRTGDVIQRMAEQQGYRMPLANKAYVGMQTPAIWEGENMSPPLANRSGETVRLFHTVDTSPEVGDLLPSERFLPFRSVDEIRIIETWLDQWVNILEMQKQKVIVRIFPAMDHDEHEELHKNWATLSLMIAMPKFEQIEMVRDYFGEQIAFFFMWFTYYIRMLGYLGATGFACYLLRLSGYLGYRQDGYIKLAFTIIMVAWASSFNSLFKSAASRCQQRWGMKDFDAISVQRHEYDPMLEGTRTLECRQWLSFAAVGLYCSVFVGVIGLLTATIAEQKEKGLTTSWAPLALSLTVKIGSFLWGKFAYSLVSLQNHRTQARFDNSLIWTLGLVKLFVALYPFIEAAFLRPYTETRCEATFAQALDKVYGGTGWPTGFESTLNATALPPDISPDDLNGIGTDSFLSGYWYKQADFYKTGKGYCISGCYPTSCEWDGDAQVWHCETSCMAYLEESVATLFFIHLLSTVVFLLIPIILTKMSVSVEVAKAHKTRWWKVFFGSCLADDEDEMLRDPYTLIQFQAKCHEQSPYGYGQWGGSFVEDFLELAIGFALMTCFGMVLPIMGFFAMLCYMVEYRLLAYRMTCVTCRPWPVGAEGIGQWQNVFETISNVAVTINVAMAAFKMAPMQHLPFYQQLIAFIVMEKALLLLKTFVDLLIPDHPDDVVWINDYYSNFTSNKKPIKTADPSDVSDWSHVNIGLSDGRPRQEYASASESDTGSSS